MTDENAPAARFDPDPAEAVPEVPAIPAKPEPHTQKWGKAINGVEERRFLEGPHDRSLEFLRVIRIALEFVKGFRALHFVGPCVTMFGSARFPETHPYYGLARELAAAVAREGFTVMTGGGPGLMEAANRGAKDVDGGSVGINITLPLEQRPNPYLDTFVQFRYFFVRKVMLAKYSYAFVAMPGGFGTMDELFEILTLIQTHKIKDFPCVLMGAEFWRPLVEFMRDTLVRLGTIEAADMDRLHVTDSPEEAIAIIREAAIRRFGLHYETKLHQRRGWLFE